MNSNSTATTDIRAGASPDTACSVPGCVFAHEGRFDQGFHQLLDAKAHPVAGRTAFEVGVFQDDDGVRASIWPHEQVDGLSAADLRAAALEYEKLPGLLREAADRIDRANGTTETSDA